METPDHSSYNHVDDLIYKQVHEDRKYEEELYNNSHHNQSQDKYNSPSSELYLKACLILLFSICKILNDQVEIISKLSQSSHPVMSYRPVQPPMATQHARHNPRFVAMYENQLSVPRCYCGMAASASLSVACMTSSFREGVTVLNKWTRLRLQNLKEKVMLTIVSVMLSEKHRDAVFEIMKSSNLEEECENSRLVIKS